MTFASNAILAKARSMYGGHLTSSDYEALLSLKSVSEVVNYLKNNTDYSSILGDIRENDVHRGQLEALLSEESFMRISRLARYGVGKERDFYMLNIMGREVNILLHVLRLINANRLEDLKVILPSYLKGYTTFDINGLLNVHNIDDLMKLIAKTDYAKVIASCLPERGKRINVNKIELELKRAYYDHYEETVKSLYKGKTQQELLKMLETSVELDNITKIYRLKKYFNASPVEITEFLLLDHTRISKRMMKELINAKDADDMLAKLSTSAYRIDVGDHDYVYIEYFTQRIEYNLAKKYMMFSTSAPLVFMTYVIVHNIEIENLKHIVEGVRYNQDADSIRKLIIQ